MKLKLSELKLTSPRVRQSQDPEKLDELAASIGAFGQAIIPIGGRKNGSGYNVIYGHRRVAAAKQAGLTEIDAIEVEAGDDMLKVFGLTENVVREDMESRDIAKALRQIKDESGWTDERVGKFFGRTDRWVARLLALLDPEILKAMGKSEGAFGPDHPQEVKAGLGAHKDLMPAVIKKVVAEGLSTRQARQVAENASEALSRFGQRGLKTVLAQRYVPMAPDTVRPRGLKSAPPKPASLLDQMSEAVKTLSGILHLMGSPRTLAEKKKHAAYVRQAIAMLETALKGARRLLIKLEEK